MTLIEITVVLMCLIAIAGIGLPYIYGTGQKAQCEATDISMQNIKRAIVENYAVDMLGHYPANKNDVNRYLTCQSEFADICDKSDGINYNLTCLFESCDWDKFDPATNVGWRGAYLQNSGLTLNADDIEQLDDSFKDKNNETIVSNYYQHVNDNLTVDNIAILDAWGRPIVLQVPSQEDCQNIMNLANLPEEGYCARLVSAGSGDGKKASIDTSLANLDTTNLMQPAVQIDDANPRTNDDRILYLQAPTPASDLNIPCDQL